MANAKVQISRVIVYPEGNGTVVTATSKENPSGAWNLTARQMQRLATSAGLSVQQLRLVKGTLCIEGKSVKAGEKWSEVDRKTGEITREGVFTKDHFRVEELSVELTPQAQMMILAASALAEQFSMPVAPLSDRGAVALAEPVEIAEHEEEIVSAATSAANVLA